MSLTDASQLLKRLSEKLPSAHAIVVTNRYGQELAENLSHEDQWMLPSLTVASSTFADRLAELTERGSGEYISLYVGDDCYSVFEIGSKWIVGILSPSEADYAALPRIVSEVALEA